MPLRRFLLVLVVLVVAAATVGAADEVEEGDIPGRDNRPASQDDEVVGRGSRRTSSDEPAEGDADSPAQQSSPPADGGRHGHGPSAAERTPLQQALQALLNQQRQPQQREPAAMPHRTGGGGGGTTDLERLLVEMMIRQGVAANQLGQPIRIVRGGPANGGGRRSHAEPPLVPPPVSHLSDLHPLSFVMSDAAPDDVVASNSDFMGDVKRTAKSEKASDESSDRSSPETLTFASVRDATGYFLGHQQRSDELDAIRALVKSGEPHVVIAGIRAWDAQWRRTLDAVNASSVDWFHAGGAAAAAKDVYPAAFNDVLSPFGPTARAAALWLEADRVAEHVERLSRQDDGATTTRTDSRQDGDGDDNADADERKAEHQEEALQAAIIARAERIESSIAAAVAATADTATTDDAAGDSHRHQQTEAVSAGGGFIADSPLLAVDCTRVGQTLTSCNDLAGSGTKTPIVDVWARQYATDSFSRVRSAPPPSAAPRTMPQPRAGALRRLSARLAPNSSYVRTALQLRAWLGTHEEVLVISVARGALLSLTAAEEVRVLLTKLDIYLPAELPVLFVDEGALDAGWLSPVLFPQTLREKNQLTDDHNADDGDTHVRSPDGSGGSPYVDHLLPRSFAVASERATSRSRSGRRHRRIVCAGDERTAAGARRPRFPHSSLTRSRPQNPLGADRPCGDVHGVVSLFRKVAPPASRTDSELRVDVEENGRLPDDVDLLPLHEVTVADVCLDFEKAAVAREQEVRDERQRQLRQQQQAGGQEAASATGSGSQQEAPPHHLTMQYADAIYSWALASSQPYVSELLDPRAMLQKWSAAWAEDPSARIAGWHDLIASRSSRSQDAGVGTASLTLVLIDRSGAVADHDDDPMLWAAPEPPCLSLVRDAAVAVRRRLEEAARRSPSSVDAGAPAADMRVQAFWFDGDAHSQVEADMLRWPTVRLPKDEVSDNDASYNDDHERCDVAIVAQGDAPGLLGGSANGGPSMPTYRRRPSRRTARRLARVRNYKELLAAAAAAFDIPRAERRWRRELVVLRGTEQNPKDQQQQYQPPRAVSVPLLAAKLEDLRGGGSDDAKGWQTVLRGVRTSGFGAQLWAVLGAGGGEACAMCLVVRQHTLPRMHSVGLRTKYGRTVQVSAQWWSRSTTTAGRAARDDIVFGGRRAASPAGDSSTLPQSESSSSSWREAALRLLPLERLPSFVFFNDTHVAIWDPSDMQSPGDHRDALGFAFAVGLEPSAVSQDLMNEDTAEKKARQHPFQPRQSRWRRGVGDRRPQ